MNHIQVYIGRVKAALHKLLSTIWLYYGLQGSIDIWNASVDTHLWIKASPKRAVSVVPSQIALLHTLSHKREILRLLNGVLKREYNGILRL